MIQQLREFLFGRRAAYARIFLGHGRDSEAVLKDLAKFCRAHTSTFHADPRVAAMLDGRREVFTRICHHLQLTDEELWGLYGDNHLNPRE